MGAVIEVLAALAVAAVTAPASTGAAPEVVGDDGKPTSRWHGSTLTFDQSATTQTLGLGADYQSADPVYEWWLALRPRFYLFERKRDALTLNLWMNAYVELTNSDTTTRMHEVLLGPTFLSAGYARTLRERGAYRTTVTAGPRFTIPTDKAARDSGQILGLGASAGVSQTFPLRGEQVRALRGARLGLTLTYNHPWNRAVAPVNDGINRIRQDVNGVLVPSDVLRGGMNVQHALNVAASGDLQVSRRLGVSLSYVVINSWVYDVRDDPLCTPLTGCVQPLEVADPTTHRVSTWLTASASYEVLDELTVSAGYYNQANQIGPDGTRRDPLWSPSARLFLSVVGNLDPIYRRVRSKL